MSAGIDFKMDSVASKTEVLGSFMSLTCIDMGSWAG